MRSCSLDSLDGKLIDLDLLLQDDGTCKCDPLLFIQGWSSASSSVIRVLTSGVSSFLIKSFTCSDRLEPRDPKLTLPDVVSRSRCFLLLSSKGNWPVTMANSNTPRLQTSLHVASYGIPVLEQQICRIQLFKKRCKCSRHILRTERRIAIPKCIVDRHHSRPAMTAHVNSKISGTCIVIAYVYNNAFLVLQCAFHFQQSANTTDS